LAAAITRSRRSNDKTAGIPISSEGPTTNQICSPPTIPHGSTSPDTALADTKGCIEGVVVSALAGHSPMLRTAP